MTPKKAADDGKPKIDPEKLKRTKPIEDDESKSEEPKVSAGTIDKVIDLAFNPSRDKMPEVTIIDWMQGRLLPQLTLVGLGWQYIIEIAAFRQDSVEYERVFGRKQPIPPELIKEFMYSTAQWQKSVKGENLKSLADIALAEIETKAEEEDDGYRKADEYFKD